MERPARHAADNVWHLKQVGIVDDARASADWISTALTSSGYSADFSPQSVWELERFLDDQAPNGAAKEGGLLSENLGPRLFAVGSYLGEVVRRSVGGEWEGDDTDPRAEINLALVGPDGGRPWPIQRVMKRFKNGPEDALPAWAIHLGVPARTGA